MQDYTELIQRRFPNDKRMDCYVKPNMPATKLGRALAKFTKIASPSDVVAFHISSGMFGSDTLLLTSSECHFDKGFFLLEDVVGVHVEDKEVVVKVNQGGAYVQFKIKTESGETARLISEVFDAIAYAPKGEAFMTPVENAYEKYSPEAVNWLELRDEVLRTVDLVHELFQAGKLSLTEYQEKKTDLLNRL